MKDISKLLKIFVKSSDDGFSSWMMNPVKVENKVIATDAYAMLILPAESAPQVKDFVDPDPTRLFAVIPSKGPVLKKVSVSDLLAALKSIPLVSPGKECDVCRGEGEVEYVFHHNGKQYENYFDCPVCNGDGEVGDKEGKMVADESKHIKIGLSLFKPMFIKKLYQFCQHFELDSVDLVSQKNNTAGSLFTCQYADLLIMPVTEGDQIYELK